MKFDNVAIYNFDNALRGMRNPLNSWYKGDSQLYKYTNAFHPMATFDEYGKICQVLGKDALCVDIGSNDLNLAKRLIKAGSEHRKFLRQIFVSMDITAPIYWWKEMDTYKLGTTSNSTSTMHKLSSNPITLDCFEIDDLADENMKIGNYDCLKFMYNQIIDNCESLRQLYNETKDIRYWKELVRWLPQGWLQTRTWTANYEVLYNIWKQRQGHKLTEWKTFINYIETFPYFKEFFIENE